MKSKTFTPKIANIIICMYIFTADCIAPCGYFTLFRGCFIYCIYCLMAADRSDLMVALLLVLRVQQSCAEVAAQALHGGVALCRGHQRPPERLT